MRRISPVHGETPEAYVQVSIPGHGSFNITAEAVTMIAVFGGLVHCYQGGGGCRKQGLYFSRTAPRRHIRCQLSRSAGKDEGKIAVSVSYDLAPKLEGAILDFGTYNKMQRFVWMIMPAVRGPSCTCLRSMGPPAGKRSPCLDDQGIGITDL